MYKILGGDTVNKWQEIALFAIAIILILILVMFSPSNDQGEKVVSPEVTELIQQIPEVMKKMGEE